MKTVELFIHEVFLVSAFVKDNADGSDGSYCYRMLLHHHEPGT